MADSDLLVNSAVAVPSTSGTRHDAEIVRPGEGQRVPLSHPNHLLQKLIAIFLMCAIGFGSVFVYDTPAALEDKIQKSMNVTEGQYMYLYSFYSWPNVILCFFGGFLLDKVFGIRLGTCIYAAFVVLGHFMYASGAYFNLFWLMVLGRFVFGIGGESLAVAQNNYAVLWFKGDSLNMVFGFQLSMSRAGSAVNFLAMEPLYGFVDKYYSDYNQCLGIVLFIAGISCISSLLAGIILARQDKHAERVLNRKQPPIDEIKISAAGNFPFSFWLTTFVIVFYYSAIFSFIAIAKDFFEKTFHMEADKANKINSIIYAMAAILSPFLGRAIDMYGKNLSFILISLLATIGGHYMLTFSLINPWISMCLIGVAYSTIAAAVWPIIALIIPEHLLGTAYGVTQSLQNLGVGLMQWMSGQLISKYGYRVLETVFICSLSVGVFLIVLLWIYDFKRAYGYLNMTTYQRNLYDQQNRLTDKKEKERLLDSNSDNDGGRPGDSDYGSSEDERDRSKETDTKASFN